MEAEHAEIYKTMRGLGIDAQSAEQLLKKHPYDFIRQKIDVLAFLLSQKPDALSSPAGYLYQSIEKDYMPPAGYKTPAQQKKEKAEKDAHFAALKTRKRNEIIAAIVTRLNRRMAQKTRMIAAEIATNMDDFTETEIRQYIDAKRPSFMRSCRDYDLRSLNVEGKPRDGGAGLVFQFLRTDFFRERNPEVFAELTYKTVAEEEFRNEFLEDALIEMAIHTLQA